MSAILQCVFAGRTLSVLLLAGLNQLHAVQEVNLAEPTLMIYKLVSCPLWATSGRWRVTGIRQQIWRLIPISKDINFRSWIAHIDLLSPLTFHQLFTGS